MGLAQAARAGVRAAGGIRQAFAERYLKKSELEQLDEERIAEEKRAEEQKAATRARETKEGEAALEELRGARQSVEDADTARAAEEFQVPEPGTPAEKQEGPKFTPQEELKKKQDAEEAKAAARIALKNTRLATVLEPIRKEREASAGLAATEAGTAQTLEETDLAKSLKAHKIALAKLMPGKTQAEIDKTIQDITESQEKLPLEKRVLSAQEQSLLAGSEQKRAMASMFGGAKNIGDAIKDRIATTGAMIDDLTIKAKNSIDHSERIRAGREADKLKEEQDALSKMNTVFKVTPGTPEERVYEVVTRFTDPTILKEGFPELTAYGIAAAMEFFRTYGGQALPGVGAGAKATTDSSGQRIISPSLRAGQEESLRKAAEETAKARADTSTASGRATVGLDDKGPGE